MAKLANQVGNFMTIGKNVSMHKAEQVIDRDAKRVHDKDNDIFLVYSNNDRKLYQEVHHEMNDHVHTIKTLQDEAIYQELVQKKATLRLAEANQILQELKKRFTDEDIRTFINYSREQF